MATMKRFLEEHLMPSIEPGEHLLPDEQKLLLDALQWFSSDVEGMRSAGRISWVIEKLKRAQAEGGTITLVP